jgi:hypothetical protein
MEDYYQVRSVLPLAMALSHPLVGLNRKRAMMQCLCDGKTRWLLLAGNTLLHRTYFPSG